MGEFPLMGVGMGFEFPSEMGKKEDHHRNVQRRATAFPQDV